MKRTTTLLFSLIVVLLFVLTGCSGVANMTAPDQGAEINSFDSIPVGVSEFDDNGNPIAGYGALGIFNVHVDPSSLTGEIVSLRNQSSTDVLEVVDITNFLMLAPCADCARIESVEIDADENLVLNIGVKHPFPAGDPTKPISGRNRADLHVFNVEGLVVGMTSSTANFAGLGEQVSDFKLGNADGYSSYLDGALDEVYNTAATLHPYILHFDDYSAGNYNPGNPMGFASVTNPPPSGNLVMSMGCDYNVQPYKFELTGAGDLDFIFAVGCTYAVSAVTKSLRFNPEYRVPQHLKKAASEVDIRIIDNQMFADDTDSTAIIEVDVVDTSHGVAVGTGLGDMKSDSSVSSIRIEVPGVMSSVLTVPLINIGGTGHSPSDPLTYEATITNNMGAGLNTYHGLVKVVDSYPSGSNGSPLLGGRDGIKRVDPSENPLLGLFAIAEFATYQVFEIDVQGLPTNPPVAILLPEAPVIFETGTVNFDGTGSYDTDGSVVLYEFDFDWDGVNAHFTADVSNSTGLATSNPYNTQGSYIAGLRVTDDLGATGYDSSAVTVNVWSSDCPVAPFAGVAFTQGFTYSDYNRLGSSEWAVWADQIVDSDVLSNGNLILIFSDGVNEGDGVFEGDLWMANPLGGTARIDVVPTQDYPGHIGISMDVDSANLAVFVTSNLPHTNFTNNNARDYELPEKVAAAHNFFYVIDPFVGVSTEKIVNVGTPIMAIDIDANDDVWVLDTNRVMHKYDKSNNYAEVAAASFDLDITTSGAFTGLVYDFVINFYNEAFFILTNGSDLTDLWRIECDGTYYSTINSNPNPMISVLPFGFNGTTHGVADIAIDNLDSAGVVHDGEQDSQIVVVGGNDIARLSAPYWDYTAQLARVDSRLGQKVTSTRRSFIEAFTNAAMNQRTNQLWGIAPGVWSDGYDVLWLPPSDWF